MAENGREASMEDILASIKRVIADDPVAANRGERPRSEPPGAEDEDVLELDQPMPGEEPLVSTGAAEASREKLARLSQLGPAPQPAPATGDGPLEAVVRDMLRPLLKDWLDRRLPEIVEELVAREVARITGAKR